MIAALALLVSTIGAIELFAGTRMMEAFGRLARMGGRSSRLVLRTGVSEWAKERAMRLMALRLLGHSLRTMALLAIVAAPIAGLLAVDAAWPFGVRAALTDWPVRLILLVVTSAYAILRRRHRISSASGQGASSLSGERLLQRLALGCAPVRDIAFDIERRLHGRAAASLAAPAPIFVVGLARAGTTVLMRALHETGDFASLSYRDLPFPLAPNCWLRATRNARRHVDQAERAHGDGMLHDLDTPEAIEEVFWKHHEGDRYLQAAGLSPVAPAAATVVLFGDYVRLVLLRYRRPRYISKNNNNVLRLPALVAAFPDAVLVHPFRDPFQQAASLLAQHRRATALAAADPFRSRFMGWMGHHEFGADRRPFLLTEGPRAQRDPDGIDHWLAAWIDTYAFLLDGPGAPIRNQLFVDYDALCRSPEDIAPALGRALQMDDVPDLAALRPPHAHDVPSGHPELARRARSLHALLKQRCALQWEDSASRPTETVAAAAAAF